MPANYRSIQRQAVLISSPIISSTVHVIKAIFTGSKAIFILHEYFLMRTIILKMDKGTLLLLLMIFVCYNSYGQTMLDSTFNNDGKLVTDIGADDNFGNSIALQPDGKIIVGGSTQNGPFGLFTLTRYDNSGALDNSFGLNGIVTTNTGGSFEECIDITIQSDGKIIAVGNTYLNSDNNIALIRYLDDGTIDSTYEEDGIAITPISGAEANAASVILQEDGKVVVSGYSHTTSNDDFLLMRYLVNGSLDPSFGTNGIVVTDIGSDDHSSSVTIQQDGKIIVAGYSYVVTNDDFALMRYNTDGTLDITFGNNGIVTTSIGNGYAFGRSVFVQPDNKIVVAGDFITFTSQIALARYNSSGTLDSSFGTNGIALTPDDAHFATSSVLQPDGKIIVTGPYNNDVGVDMAVVRFNGDGTVDQSFGNDGAIITDIAGSEDVSYDITLQPDGKIVIAGHAWKEIDIYAYADFAVVRYLPELNTGTLYFDRKCNSMIVYPNPVGNLLTLEYVLEQEQMLSIYLCELSGKIIQCLLRHVNREQGSHKEILMIVNFIPDGNYLLTLDNGTDNLAIRIMKKGE